MRRSVQVLGAMMVGWTLVAPGTVLGQGVGAGQGYNGVLGTTPGVTTGIPGFGSPYPTPNSNPYMNPYLNPFLNPFMTQFPTNRRDTALYFLAAQQARAGMAMPNGGLPNGGTTSSSAASRTPSRTTDRTARSTAAGTPSGWYNDNPTIEDRRGQLARRFAAYGPYGGGGAGSPDRRLGRDQGVGRYFNRYPKRDPGNTR